MSHCYRLLCALLLLASPAARAQAPDSLRQALDHFFAPLDKSQLPTGRLREYAEPIKYK